MAPDDTIDRLAELLHYWLQESERTDERAADLVDRVEKLAARLPPTRAVRWRLVFGELLRTLPPAGSGAISPEAA